MTARRRASAARALFLSAALAAVSCNRQLPPVPAADPKPITLSLSHLRRLGLDVKVGEQPVRVVALYAEAPDYAPVGSPARDGYEGIAAVDDAARAAIAYLRSYEISGDSTERAEAIALLRFVAAMEQGDGEFVNFVDTAGRLNRGAVSSRKSMSYWAARGLWALAEGVRVLGPDFVRDSTPWTPVLDRTVRRLAREVDASRLVGGSATATAEALLGLLALHSVTPTEASATLALRTAALLVPLERGTRDRAPWGMRTDAAGTPWHAWGARTVSALAEAGAALDRPELVEAAQREADHLWSRFLLAGQVPWEIRQDGDVRWFPQIAYGIGSVVEGYLALASATGEQRYAILAGLTAAWFTGANAAGVPMYDGSSGRTFDGIDMRVDSGAGAMRVQLNRNAGAESTIEALLALQRVAASPEASRYLHYRPVGERSASLTDIPEERTFIGPGDERIVVRGRASGGVDVVRERPTNPVVLTYWPAANPPETRLALKLAERWNAENPDVQVRVQPLPAGRSSEEVLLAAIVARATPDVSSNVSSALLSRLVRANGVVRLDDRVATSARLRERTTASMVASLRLPDGGLYAFPWKTNPEMLMYNVDLLAAAGVRPPRTHDELLDALRKLARDTDGDGRLDRWGMWANLKTTWYERFYDFYPLYLSSSGGQTLVRNGEVVFDNPAAVQALETLRTGFREGTLPKSNFAQGRDPFIDGTVAMKIIGPWFLKELDELKVAGLRYDVTPVPARTGTRDEDRYAFADLRNIAIFSTTKHPDAAARFVAYLTSPEADRMMIEDASQLPYRRTLASDRRFRSALAKWQTLTTYAAHVSRARDIDLDPDIVEFFDLLSEAYEGAAVYGTVPVRQALTRAATEARKIVNAR